MAQLGIMAATFTRLTLEERLDAVVASGVRSVQFDLACAGLPTLPEEIDAADCARVRGALVAREIELAALSGTYNMIDPDVERRRDGQRRLAVLTRAAAALGTSVITLCTGTRDTRSMWRRHPANGSSGAWADLVAGVAEAVRVAEEQRVVLAFEPEVANVVDSAARARRLLDEIKSPWLKVVMDGANIFHAGELPRMGEVLDEAFDLLGADIALAHAKDLDHDGEAGHQPAGRGLLDYPRYLQLLMESGYQGAVVLHGLPESEVEWCLSFVRDAAPPGLWDPPAEGLAPRVRRSLEQYLARLDLKPPHDAV